MNDEAKPTEASHSKGKRTEVEDPRSIITPDAFTVSDKLLGLPLATPGQRAMAMLIDLVIVSQLARLGMMALVVSILIIIALLSQAKSRRAVGQSRRAILLTVSAIGLIGIIGYTYLHPVISTSTEVIEQAIEAEQESVKQQTDNPELEAAQKEIERLEARVSELENSFDEKLFSSFDELIEQLDGIGWAAVYFTLSLYLLKGQTIGKLMLGLRVLQLDDQPISIWNSLGRYGGYAASFVVGLTGFLQIFWDPNRQGLHDRIANTVVVKSRQS